MVLGGADEYSVGETCDCAEMYRASVDAAAELSSVGGALMDGGVA
jgi:hypothetical protein